MRLVSDKEYTLPRNELDLDCSSTIEKAGIEFECIPTDKNSRAICDFEWTANLVSNNTVNFKINFKRPIEVS